MALPASPAEASRAFLPMVGGGEGSLCILDLATRDLRALPLPPALGVLCPRWSPDGTHIAAAVTDGTFLRPAIFTPDGPARILSEHSLDLVVGSDLLHWIDADTLACAFLPRDTTPRWLDAERRGAQACAAAWRLAWAGRHPTASRISSDQPRDAPEPVDLCAIDIHAGERRSFGPGDPLSERMRERANRPPVDYPATVVGTGHPVPRESVLVASAPEADQAIYLARSDDATRLWQVAGGRATPVFETDTHLAEVHPSGMRILSFRMPGGREERVRCILPPGHREGERRPAVVWVYPGTALASDFLHRYHLFNTPGFLNLHLLAARGFVVLVPDMPEDAQTRAGRTLAETLGDSVIPAVEAATAAGLVDPDRLHVAGHSAGGWASLVLLAETEIFRGAICIAGLSNLISAFCATDVRFRDEASASDLFPTMMEEAFFLAAPPWRIPDQYIRNSPIFLAEAITAPVLLLHGDQDYVEISQAEQMFAALRSVGRPVELVRYWGEGHIFASPANIRDAWTRVFD